MKKPIIGITCSIRPGNRKRRFPTPYAFEYLNFPYHQAIEKAGATPVLLSNLLDLESIDDILGLLDGLLMSGGGDVFPRFYQQQVKAKLISTAMQRDEFEIKLAQKAHKERIPVLGICRGAQVINVAFGGSLLQDFKLKPGYLDHTRKGRNLYLRKHQVEVKEDTLLFSIVKKKKVTVNTSHHQMIGELAPVFEVSARSAKDQVIEAIEYRSRLILGVQWHPEVMKDISSNRIFKWLIDQARGRWSKKRS